MFFFSPLIHCPCTVWMGVNCGFSPNPVNYTVMFNKFVDKVVYYGFFFSPLIHYPCTV